MIKNILLVGFGGFLGSVLRYITYLIVDKRFSLIFPLSTFTVNIIGSFILGIVVGLSLKGNVSEHVRLLLAVGICGSYTTFSTFAMENFNLLSQKELFISILYISLSVLFGLISIFAGQWIVK